MSQTQHTVAVLPSSATAEVIRRQLEGAGIQTTTVEEDSNFRVQVDEADFQRAMQLLFPAPQPLPGQTAGGATGQAWFCANCGEEVQAMSDACWACGKPRAGAAAAAPKASGPAASAATKPFAPAPVAPAKVSANAVAQRAAPQQEAAPAEAEKDSAASPLLLGALVVIVIVVTVVAWLAVRGS